MLDANDRSFVYRLAEVAGRRGMERKKFGLMPVPNCSTAASMMGDDGTEEDVACYAAALAVWLGRSPSWHIPGTPDEMLHRMCFVLLRIKLFQAPALRKGESPPASVNLQAALPGPEDDQMLPPGRHVEEVEMFSACFHFLGRAEHCLPVAYHTDDYGAVTPPGRAPFAVSSDAEERAACLHVYRTWRDAAKRTHNPGKLAVALVAKEKNEEARMRRRMRGPEKKRKRNAVASTVAVTSLTPTFSAYEIVRFVNTFTLRLQDFRYAFPEVLREEEGTGQWAQSR